MKFYSSKTELEGKTIELIHETFRHLRSAEGAFDLLQNFKNIAVIFLNFFYIILYFRLWIMFQKNYKKNIQRF